MAAGAGTGRSRWVLRSRECEHKSSAVLFRAKAAFCVQEYRGDPEDGEAFQQWQQARSRAEAAGYQTPEPAAAEVPAAVLSSYRLPFCGPLHLRRPLRVAHA